jgi:hypothetical protein
MPIQFNGTGTITGLTAAVGGGGTTTSSATDITLTNASAQVQNVTMTANDKFIILPNATTLSKGGVLFKIYNAGGPSFGIKNAAGNILIDSLANGQSTVLYLTDNSTSAGIWASDSGIYTVSGKPYVTSSLSYFGAIATTFGIPRMAALSSTTFLVVTRSAVNTLVATVGTWTGSTITFGASTTISTSASTVNELIGVIGFSATSAAITYADTSNNIRVVATSISGTTISFGTASTVGSQGYNGSSFIKINSTTGLITYNSGSTVVYARVFTVSGTTITVGSQTTVSANAAEHGFAVLVDTNKVLFINNAPGSSTASWWRTATISGTTLSLAAEVLNNSFALAQAALLFSTRTNQVFVFPEAGNNQPLTAGYLVSTSGASPSATSFAITPPQPDGIGNFYGYPGAFDTLSAGKVLFTLGTNSGEGGLGVWNDQVGLNPSGVNYSQFPTLIWPRTVTALSSTTAISASLVGVFASFSYLEIA